MLFNDIIKNRFLNVNEILNIFLSIEGGSSDYNSFIIEKKDRISMPNPGTFFIIKMSDIKLFKNDGYTYIKRNKQTGAQQNYRRFTIDNYNIQCIYTTDNKLNIKRRVYKSPSNNYVIFHYLKDNKNKTTKNNIISIVDYTPLSDNINGGSKMLIVIKSSINKINTKQYVKVSFGNLFVNATFVADNVLKCYSNLKSSRVKRT